MYATEETHLPATKEIKDLLVMLLGRDVTLTPTSPLAPSTTAPRSCGVYVDDRLGIRALIACDLEFSARAGAALALVPSRVAESAIASNGIDENLSDNLFEVFNVATSLFNVDNAAHLRLQELHPAGVAIPPPVQMRMLTLGRREDLLVDISGYGSGRLSVVICA